MEGGQNLAGLLVFITDVHALGLKTAQGLIFTEAWYWDLNDANRAFAKEFAAANKGNMPTMVQAGVYSAVTHYLKAVHALKSRCRRRRRGGQDEGDADRRQAVRQGQHPRRTAARSTPCTCSR